MSSKRLLYIEIAILITYFLFFLITTFSIGPDPLVDSGRELYVPWAIKQGKVLYKDILYFNGPFSPLFNAFIFNFIPLNVFTSKLVNAIILFFTALAGWMIVRCRSGRVSAALATLLFLSVFGLSVLPYGYMNDYLTPYSHEATHGLFLCLWGFVALRQFEKRKSTSPLILIGVIEALLFLSKPEFFAASLAIPLAALVSSDRKSKTLFWTTISFIVTLLPFLTYFIFKLGLFNGIKSLISPWFYIFTTSVSSTYYYRLVLGLEGFRYNLETSLAYLALYLGIYFVIRLSEKFYHQQRKITLVLLAMTLVAATIFIFQYRVLEDFCAGFSYFILIMFIYRSLKERNVFESAFLLFSLLLMLKIFFKVAVYGYGFVLVPASIFAIFITLNKPTWPMRLSSIYLSLVLIIAYSVKTYSNTTENQYQIGRKQNAFTVAYPFRNYNEVINLVERHVPEDKSLVAFPEGLFLNFITQRTHPVRSTNFMPPEFEIFGEQTILNDLIEGKPDYIMLIDNLTRPDFIYNSNFFNQDYALMVHQWIFRHYHQVDEYSDTGGQYKLMKRNEYEYE